MTPEQEMEFDAIRKSVQKELQSVFLEYLFGGGTGKPKPLKIILPGVVGCAQVKINVER